MEKLMGITVEVYRPVHGIDCTNGGITSNHSELTLLWEERPELYEIPEDRPAVIVQYHGDHCFAVPVVNQNGKSWRFGGNFIFSSDSSFREVYSSPIPVHDRQE